MHSKSRLSDSQSGFTLIELMIVIAIIGILAAIAIPQFEAYHRRSRRTKSISMLGIIRASQAALTYDVSGFGSSNTGLLPTAQPAVAGTTWDATNSPLLPATATVAGEQLSAGAAAGEFSGFPIDIPHGVICRVDTDAIPGQTYLAIAYSLGTNRLFGLDYETQQNIYYEEDYAFVPYAAADVNGQMLAADATDAFAVAGWHIQ